MPRADRSGGCQCGKLRYEIDAEPLTLAICHCCECQRQTGSAFGMSMVVPEDAFRVTLGTPRCFSRASESGRVVECYFCGDCGTRIYHDPTALPGVVNVKAGTLDDTSTLSPHFESWASRKQHWVTMPSGLRSFAVNPKP